MALSSVDYLRTMLSGHLTSLAFLTAVVVVLGDGSPFLPSMVFLVGVFSFTFVDCLKWFSLPRWMATLGIICGTLVSLVDYGWGVLYADSPTHQLFAVASLLIYPQIVLLLQCKNVRIFEQLSIFLLLEVIVASLVNDSLLFGLLLIPIVILWVASLYLLTRYAAIIRLDPTLETPTPRLMEMFIEFVLKQRAKSMVAKKPGAEVAVFPLKAMNSPRFSSLISHTIPISIATSVIACLYFGLLPRTEAAKYTVPQGVGVQTGFSKHLTLGMIGRMLQDKTPAFRLKLTHASTGRPYILSEAPYIRGVVYGQYGKANFDPTRETNWFPVNYEADRGNLPKLGDLQVEVLKNSEHAVKSGIPMEPFSDDVRDAYTLNRDAVRVQVDQLSDNGVLFAIAPFFSIDRSAQETIFFPFDWRLVKVEDRAQFGVGKLAYNIVTTGFSKGRNVRLIPFDNGHFTPDRDNRAYEREFERVLQNAGLAPAGSLNALYLDEALRLSQQLNRLKVMTLSGSRSADEQNFRALLELKKRVLKETGVSANDPVSVALALENFFVSSGEYKYSLDSMQRDLTIDPVEDFIVNQKQGHCQYFASALALMLRHSTDPESAIPTRVVGGFHPHEFNQLGKYFVVRNSDAHVWVEAYFSSEQLKASGIEPSFPCPFGCWLTLDPTPEAEGDDSSLREPPDQAIDYAQQLWTDYVIEAHQLTSEDGLYAQFIAQTAAAGNLIMKSGLQLYSDIRNGTLVQRYSLENWFSWPFALAAFFIAGTIALLMRSTGWLPRLAPKWVKHLGLSMRRQSVAQLFFAKCLRLLTRYGFHRSASQTPKELTDAAAKSLANNYQIPSARSPLTLLTDLYYRIRFSSQKSLTEIELSSINEALRGLEETLALKGKKH